MKPLTIGRLSRAANVKVTTIRYYETIGLMGTPDRSASGQRLYEMVDVERLSFIRHARELGFSIDAIKDLIGLQTAPDQDCSAVDSIAQKQLVEVQKRLAQLEALERELKRMIENCRGGEIGGCQVMAAINNHAECESEKHERLKPL